MPLYYDTSSPNKDNKNTITRTATEFGIRDFLLLKNIQNPIRYPQYSTSINGSPQVGQPVLDTMVNGGVVNRQNPLEVDGVPRYNNAVSMNLYKNTDGLAPQFTDIENVTKIDIYPTPANGTTNYGEIDINKFGLLSKMNFKEYRKKTTLKNLYVDETKQTDGADSIVLQTPQQTSQYGSYLDEFGNIAIQTSTEAVDILGSFINGQGIGFGSNGIVSNFDFKSTLLSRTLTSTGIINDTRLGVIASQQLALSLSNNIAYNVQQEIFGRFNVSNNILSIVRNGTLEGFRPNYKITKPITTGGQVVDVASRILGFNVPKSYLPEGGSIFTTESGAISNIDRANNMLEATGEGQVQALSNQFYANLNGISKIGIDNPDNTPFRSAYSPRFQIGANGNFIVEGKKPLLYAFNDSSNSGFVYPFINSVTNEEPIPEISYNREKMVENSGFVGFEANTYTVNDGEAYKTKFTWTSGSGKATNAVDNYDEFTGNDISGSITKENRKKSLLYKTQLLFNSVGMKTLVSVKGDKQQMEPTQLQTAISKNKFLSKGSAVMSGDKFNADGSFKFGNDDTPDNTFCRVWTPFNRYDRVNKQIRNRGLNQSEISGGKIFPENSKWRISTEGSVLDDNGYVKIAPYRSDFSQDKQKSDSPKKYMFSIENLAWVGATQNLPQVEQGPGDLLTGKHGRIMWFPPYDLRFDETSSTNLESTNFIGRGEPIYTYNNTERTGNLSFKIIVDHPSILNSFAGNNGPTDEFIRSWFAGCVDLDNLWADKLSKDEVIQQEVKVVKNIPKVEIPKVELPQKFSIYFKNDRTDVDPNYEYAPSGQNGIGNYESNELKYRLQPNGQCIKQTYKRFWDDQKSFGLNLKPIKVGTSTVKWIDPNFGETLKTYLTGEQFKNRKIKITVFGFASTQGCVEQNKILAQERADNTKTWLSGILNNIDNITIIAKSGGETGAELTSAVKEWEKTPKEARRADITFEVIEEKTEVPQQPEIKNDETQNVTLSENVKRRYYTESDFFEKLKQDDPLVFDKISKKIKYFDPAFHSMTPEGFNSRLTFLLQCTRQGATINGIDPKNLAFGPAPVCILRIGDFYNTKIMIDNVSFNFDEPQWDLNPEGVGVQPMIADVTISFKYIGGSTLYGPINKLQNALSFNYFANTHVYDARADRISKDANNKYSLVKGLDMTQDNGGNNKIETISEKEIEKTPDIDQKKSSEESNSGNNSTPQNDNTNDAGKFVVKYLKYGENDAGQYIYFVLSRKDQNDDSELKKDYQLKLSIQNQIAPFDMYQVTLPTTLTKTAKNYLVNVSTLDLTPNVSNIDYANGKYIAKTIFIGANNNYVTTTI